MIKNPFTLLELSVVLLIIVSLASFIASQGLPIVEKTIETQYEKNVIATATAVVGDKSYRDYDGSIIPFGYLNDMGSFPAAIEDLWTEPSDSGKLYSKRTFTINGVDGHLYGGWNGPYYQAANENLESRLRLEVGDFNEDPEVIDNDDIKLYASGYPESEIIEYGERKFTTRTIEIKGIPPEFTAKVTIHYISEGELAPPLEENIRGSGDTTLKLPNGVCAFYAEFLEGTTDHTVLKIVDDANNLPTIDGDYFVTPDGATGVLIGHDNKIVEKIGTNYQPRPEPNQISDRETLYDQDQDQYYLFHDDALNLEYLIGKQTSGIIKTVETDFQLWLE